MSITDQTTENESLSPCQTPIGTNYDRANEKPTAFAERGLAENVLNTLEQINDILRSSTIAKERGKDAKLKFWATYKRVSDEYDDDFLERANDDMAIILIFADLFSVVNSTFIVGVQPNPADTTNFLMLQLIKIVAEGPNAVNDINGLPSSTGYSSSTVWMQTLTYASLSFSVLAAFGAVMGKQWLSSFKASRRRGSLEERSFQRQKRLDGLEYWHLQTVLRAFLVLLQISFLLFGLSLSANMWTQQRTISSVIISATALGILFYNVVDLF
ncbi:hypothetical protein M405DRAFT_862296 [Rhizopogon salebrosus TDB-379]|nr:hypothetical protein M405DRAFT_862296 [Rhizopogon salebrosus TDB-379]